MPRMVPPHMGDPWIAVIVSLIASLSALGGAVVGAWLQGRRERSQWLADRRHDAYARLSFATSEIGSATGEAASVRHDPDFPPEFVDRSMVKWEKAHREFNAAQHYAALIAGKGVVPVVEQISKYVGDMVDAMSKASRQGDPATGPVTPGDPEGLEEVERAGKALNECRGRLVNSARSELRVVK